MRDKILRGVARNPAAPVDVLRRLLTAEAQTCWEVLCAGRDLPAELVDDLLVHPDPRVRKQLARNPYLDPAQLARLIDDPNPMTVAHLAVGPRERPPGTSPRPLPDDTIRRLLSVDDGAMTAAEIFQELAFSPFARKVFDIAAAHPDPEVRVRACGLQLALSEERRQALRDDPDQRVCEAFAAALAYDAQVMEPGDLPPHHGHARGGLLYNRRLSRALVDHVVGGADLSDLRSLAYNSTTPADIVEMLVSHPDTEIRSSVAARDDLTAEQLSRLADDAEEPVRIAVSTHPGLSEAQRAAIAVSCWPADSVDRIRMAPLPELAVSIAHAYSVNPLLRRDAARDPRLPHAVAARLAEDQDRGVRVRLAYFHECPPPAVLLRSYLEHDGPDRLHLTTRPGFPTAGLVRFARDPDPAARLLALLDPEVPGEIVDQLVSDPDSEVRAAAAAHPRLPADRLHELLDTAMATHAAANPRLTATTLHDLLDAAGIPTA